MCTLELVSPSLDHPDSILKGLSLNLLLREALIWVRTRGRSFTQLLWAFSHSLAKVTLSVQLDFSVLTDDWGLYDRCHLHGITSYWEIPPPIFEIKLSQLSLWKYQYPPLLRITSYKVLLFKSPTFSVLQGKVSIHSPKVTPQTTGYLNPPVARGKTIKSIFSPLQ